MSQALWQTFHFYGSIFLMQSSWLICSHNAPESLCHGSPFLAGLTKKSNIYFFFKFHIYICDWLKVYFCMWFDEYLGHFSKNCPVVLVSFVQCLLGNFRHKLYSMVKLIHILKSPLNVRFCSIGLGIHAHCHIF